MPEECALRNLRIQQLGKARIVDHALEVVVGARLEAVPGIQFDGASEVGETILRMPGDGVEQRQPVKCVVGVGMGGQNAC
jgi:hypothetical protein